MYKFTRLLFNIKMILQKIFRKNHLNDCEIWGAYNTIAKRILPILISFRKLEKHGVPIYAKDKAMTEEKWNNILDDMILGFKFIIYEDSPYKLSKWYIDVYGEDPYDKNLKNEHKVYVYEKQDGSDLTVMSSEKPTENIPYREEKHYHNDELIKKSEMFVDKQLKMFSKYFFDLWD